MGPGMLREEEIVKLLSSGERKIIRDQSLKLSAVNIPMFVKDDEYHILLTRRSFKVSSHKGQISFPGGKFHPGEDADLMETAMRETEEEVGIRMTDQRILGGLDDLRTHSSGYIISPFVGTFPYPYDFKLNSFEVNEVILVPLAVLLDKKNYKEKVWLIQGEPYNAYLYRYGDNIIWGATARILKHFLGLLRTIIPN